MLYDYSKLTGRIIEKFGSRAAFARSAGTTLHSVSKKLNNAAKLSQDDIFLWSEILEIDDADIRAYFFTPRSQPA